MRDAIDVLEMEHARMMAEASAYIGIAAINKDDPEVDARYMRMGHAYDRMAELIAEEIQRRVHASHG